MQLITAEPVPFDMAGAEGFVYDKNGNRRFDRGAKDYKYDAANRVLNNSVYTYTHDANGNLASRTEIASSATVTYAYTPQQQLSEVVTPKDKLEYKYDHLGRRIGRTVSGNTGHYVYDGQDIIAELDEAGNQVNTYTNGPGIDEPLVMAKPDGKNYYYHADALGSITAITDDNRKLVETYTYKSYGQPTIKDASRQIVEKSSIGNLRMFAAREYEPEIGLYNNRHRYLDPSRGAFTQEDPIGFVEGNANIYIYSFLNPQRYTDPSGLFGLEDMPSIPQGAVNFSAGFGDALLFMQGERLRRYACVNNVDRTASVYWGGVIAGNAALLAAPIVKPFNAATQTITHWGAVGEVASGVIQEGKWVMMGEKNISNYIFSGAIEKYEYNNAITTVVPGATLKYPGGWEWIKGLLGQRIYKP